MSTRHFARRTAVLPSLQSARSDDGSELSIADEGDGDRDACIPIPATKDATTDYSAREP
jgi:hypothetical protein